MRRCAEDPQTLPTTPGPGGEQIEAFRALVLTHYRDNARDLPWRRTRDPYHVLVSEVMLQQTQVPRVLPKYEEFVAAFPTIATLAVAPLTDVLRTWQGLGYNRRALALKRTAEIVMTHHDGTLPRAPDELRTLPGIGPATAGAMAAFAYGLPVVFIETNIRAVFLHHFFPKRTDVRDGEIMPFVGATLDRENPRDWYLALMDYGVSLKKMFPNPGRRSRHHARQTPFTGSRRELRAQVLRLLLASGGVTRADLAAALPRWSEDEVEKVVKALERDGFLAQERDKYRVS